MPKCQEAGDSKGRAGIVVSYVAAAHLKIIMWSANEKKREWRMASVVYFANFINNS